MTSYTCNLAGESHRQDVIRRCHEGERVILKREPDNEYDGNAVAVFRLNGDHIAYLSRENAEWVARVMDEGRQLDAKIKWITGGTRDKPSRGVLIDITIDTRRQIDQDQTAEVSRPNLLQRLLRWR